MGGEIPDVQFWGPVQRSEMQAEQKRIHSRIKKNAWVGIEQGQKACVTASARVWYLEPKWLQYKNHVSTCLDIISGVRYEESTWGVVVGVSDEEAE